jgi:hypothetical protein
MYMALTVSRMSGGMPINGDEYARDKDGNLMLFISVSQAQDFLIAQGIPEDILDYYFYDKED